LVGWLRPQNPEVQPPHPEKHGASWRTKSQIQGLNRTAPILPILPLRIGLPEKRTHNYVRAPRSAPCSPPLEITTGEVTATCRPRLRH